MADNRQKMMAAQLRSPTVAEIAADPEKYRKMSEEAVDNEFELGIAPYLNYKGPIDAENMNYIGFPSGTPKVNLQGFVGKGSSEPKMEGRIDGVDLSVPDGPKGSVNAVDKGATARTYAHEIRHARNPRRKERTIRELDGYNAQNEADFQEAILLYGQKIGASTMDEAEAALLATLKRMEQYKADDMNDNPYWKRRGKKPKAKIESEEEFWDTIKREYKEDKAGRTGSW